MKLGAQFYSVRHMTQNESDLRESFRRLAEMGYEVAQMSAISPTIPAEAIRDISMEFSMPIPVTHSPFDRILNDTDKLIAEHKIYGASTIGLGSMGGDYRSFEGFRVFRDLLTEPIKKIKDAGLNFAYHNHAFEFLTVSGETRLYDLMLEEAPEFNFIPDTYWMAYAGVDVCAYLKKIGGARMTNVHYKDLARDEARSICACGDGTLDFTEITRLCEEEGVQNVLVEQDNAPSFPDAFEEMQKSFLHLNPIIHH